MNVITRDLAAFGLESIDRARDRPDALFRLCLVVSNEVMEVAAKEVEKAGHTSLAEHLRWLKVCTVCGKQGHCGTHMDRNIDDDA